MYGDHEDHYPAGGQTRIRPRSKGGIGLTEENLRKVAEETGTRNPEANSEAPSVPTNICSREDFERTRGEPSRHATTATRRLQYPAPTVKTSEPQPWYGSPELYTGRSSGMQKPSRDDTRREPSSKHRPPPTSYDDKHNRPRTDHRARDKPSRELVQQSRSPEDELPAHTDLHETRLVERSHHKSRRDSSYTDHERRRSSTDKSLVPVRSSQGEYYEDDRRSECSMAKWPSDRPDGRRGRYNAGPVDVPRGPPTLASYQGPPPDLSKSKIAWVEYS
jgi:hypothetical protein